MTRSCQLTPTPGAGVSPGCMENIHELQHPLLAKPCQGGPVGEVRQGHPGFFARPGWRHLPPPSPELAQQLLDTGTLQKTAEPLGSPDLAPHPEPCGEISCWRKKGYSETAFGEPATLPKKFCLEKDIHTVCCEVGNRKLPEFEDDLSSDSDSDFASMLPWDNLGLAMFSMLCCFWPLGIAAFHLSQKTNKASAQGNFLGAQAVSCRTFTLAVLSIVLCISTFINAVVALVAYLSDKAPS